MRQPVNQPRNRVTPPTPIACPPPATAPGSAPHHSGCSGYQIQGLPLGSHLSHLTLPNTPSFLKCFLRFAHENTLLLSLHLLACLSQSYPPSPTWTCAWADPSVISTYMSERHSKLNTSKVESLVSVSPPPPNSSLL